MKVLLVVNAAASSVTARRRLEVGRALAAHAQVEVAETNRRGHGTELAHTAVRDGADAVVVLGGDGTLNEVAAALAGTDCALGALPGGSTNVLARTIGLPSDTVQAARVVADSLAAGRTERIGLGEANGRPFVFHFGMGWDARLVELTERHSELKRTLGHLLFVWAGLRTLTGAYDRRRPHLRVDFDDGEVLSGSYFTLVMNSDPYTYVGNRPFTISPAADLHSGLSVASLTSMSVARFLPVVIDALADGRGLGPHPGLHLRTNVSGLRVRRLTSMPVQIDGDHLGGMDEVRIAHRPAAVSLVVPAGRPPRPGGPASALSPRSGTASVDRPRPARRSGRRATAAR